MKNLIYVLSFMFLVSCSKDSKNKVLATVNGTKITQNELEKKYDDLTKQLNEMKEREQKFVKYFLDQEVENVLLKLEADARKISVEELINQEVESKVKEVNEEEISKFAQERNIPKEQFAGLKDKIKAYLSRSTSTDAKSKFAAELKKKYTVKYNLEKPAKAKVKFKEQTGDPATGNLNSKITVVEFSDFECPYCAKGADVFKKLKAEYSDKVKFIFKQFPLSFHKNAQAAAEASLCANEQGKFFEYHDTLFTNNKALEKENLSKYAASINLDAAKFKECLDSGRMKAKVEQDMKEGQEYGITGVPAFIIDGELVVGAVPYEEVKTVLDEALNK